MVYQWRSGYHSQNISAQTAGEVCSSLAAQNRLTASELVFESTPENAPLHSAFEWNDTTAAYEYRKSQARGIIRAIVTVPVEAPRENAQPVRAFFKVEPASSRYDPLPVVLHTRDLRAQLVEMARSDMRSFASKYTVLKELASVIAAMEASELWKGDPPHEV